MKNFSFANLLRPNSLGQELSIWANQYGSRPAVTDGKTCLTYMQLQERVEVIAAGLYERELRPGMRVIMQFANSLEFILATFACFRLGVIPILTLPAYREADLDNFCSAVTPSAYFAPARHAGFTYTHMMDVMSSRHDSLKLLINDTKTTSNHISLDELTGSLPELPYPDADTTALVIMTGGTTNLPKLVPKIHNQYVAAAKASASWCGMTRDSVYLVTLPIGHHFCMGCPGIIGTFSLGAKVVLASSPSFDEVFSLIEQEGVTHMPSVPPLLRSWTDARAFDESDLSSLQLIQVGGGAVDSETMAEAKVALNCNICQAYGFTEGYVCYTEYNNPDVIDNGQVQGPPLFEEDELRIVDESGKDLPPGQEGELIFRGPCMLSSYFMQNDVASSQWLTSDGYYRSGDIASWTDTGRVRIIGRFKDIINRAGEKFSAGEIELRLKQHPAVADAAVVGVPDRLLGERQCCFIIPKTEQKPLLAELHSFLRAQGVAPFMLPDQLEFVDKWPVTAVGKLNKRTLALMGQELGRRMA